MSILVRDDSASVINWYSDIPNKNRHTFAIFDIENFYPSITEKLLTDSINFAKQYTNIPDRDIDIIMHSRESLLFNNGNAWIKKDNSSFDVTMGSYDGTDISCNKDEFNKAKTTYADALKSSGYTASLSYNKHRQNDRPSRNRKRNVIWYNPPFNSSVKTNIGKTFLRVPMKWKMFCAYLKGLSKYRRMAFFFLKYLFSF